jgi:hypothetical protein
MDNQSNIPPEILQRIMAGGGTPIFMAHQQDQRPEPIHPESHNTEFQLRVLIQVVNNLESFIKYVDRPEQGEGPAVLVTDEDPRMAASATISAATSRMTEILCDDRRWQRLPQPSATRRAPKAPITPTDAQEPKAAKTAKASKKLGRSESTLPPKKGESPKAEAPKPPAES